MYCFKPETDFDAFDAFVAEHHGQYHQTSMWPKVKTTWKAHFFVGTDEATDERVLTCLILERQVPLIGKLWYIPYGTVSDMTNETLQREFAAFLEQAMKEHKVFCTAMDPPIPLWINGECQEAGVKAHELLTSLGYKLNADVQSYTYKSPVQTPIALKDEAGLPYTIDQLIKACDKGIRYSVRIGQNRGLTSAKYHYADLVSDEQILADFQSVMGDTSERNSFAVRDRNYLLNLIKQLDEYTDITMVYYDPEADRKLEEERQRELAEKREALETAPQKKVKGLKNDIEVLENGAKAYEQRQAEIADLPTDRPIAVAGGLTIRYAGWASCVFGGSKNILRNNTRPSHYLHYLRLRDSIEAGCDYHDLGYVLTDNPTDDPAGGILGQVKARKDFQGISDFKLSFGADYLQYIGEYLLIRSNAKFLTYWLLMPKAKKILAKLARRG